MAEAGGTDSARRSSHAGSGSASRPLSYASVVTGAPATSSTQPTRFPAFSQNVPALTSSSFPPQYQQDTRPHGSAGFREYDISTYNGAASHRRALSSSSASRLQTSEIQIQPFTVPRYLRNSRYARKLEAVYNARVRALRDSNSVEGSGVHGLTWHRSNHPRIAPSHRGMTYDIIESNPPVEEETLPLPSRLSSTDKYQGLDLHSDGLEVKYNGGNGKDLEAASIRSDHPMPPQCGIFYYEITISQKHKDCVVAIGFSAGKVSLERLPGWEADSWGYHGDEAKIFAGAQNGQPYRSSFGLGDVVGCGVDFNKGQAFFTKNGLDLGIAFRDLDLSTPIFPCIGMKKHSGVIIKANFGATPFVYDIDNRVNQETENVNRQIARIKTSALHPGHKTEASFTAELVAQFLLHGGYVDTAKEFVAQVQSQNEDLELPSAPLRGPETDDARPRQLIRQAILRGDIDTALDATEQSFPTVFSKFPQVIFQLKCRKFVELVAKAAELGTITNGDAKGKAQSNGEANANRLGAVDDVFDQHMDLDEEQPSVNGHAKPFPSDGHSRAEYDRITSEALRYGQALKAEYRDEDDEQLKLLHDIFSLMPYYNPASSQNGHLLETSGRNMVAEELNAAILSKFYGFLPWMKRS